LSDLRPSVMGFPVKGISMPLLGSLRTTKLACPTSTIAPEYPQLFLAALHVPEGIYQFYTSPVDCSTSPVPEASGCSEIASTERISR
jgi:hypothetical protein